MSNPREPWPEFIQRCIEQHYFAGRIGAHVSGDYELFFLDLSAWKLRLSERTPLIRVRSEVAARFTSHELLANLQQLAREHKWRRECLVLLDAAGQELRAQAGRLHYPYFLILDEDVQRQLLGARSFTTTFQDEIVSRLPLSVLSPYQISAPAEGSRFFGREREIARILRAPESSFAVYGIRRIGKTSLLREIRRRLKEEAAGEEPVVWLDSSTFTSAEQFTREVVRQLYLNELARLELRKHYAFDFVDFMKRMHRKYGGQITIFVDEVDRVMEWWRWNLLPVLRATINAGYCRYIVAGFGNLMSEITDSSSPFYLGFEPLQLGPYIRSETAEAVLRPMQSLRVRFESESEAIAQIHNDTRGHPALVQYYCIELIKDLEKLELRTLSQHALTRIYASDAFKSRVVSGFRNNVDLADKQLVYVLLLAYPEADAHFSLVDMHTAMEQHGCRTSIDELDRACERLTTAAILTRQGTDYYFALPIFTRTMRANYNVAHLLSEAKKELQQ